MPSLQPNHGPDTVSRSKTMCTSRLLSSRAPRTEVPPISDPIMASSFSAGAKDTREISRAVLNFLELKGLSPQVMNR